MHKQDYKGGPTRTSTIRLDSALIQSSTMLTITQGELVGQAIVI